MATCFLIGVAWLVVYYLGNGKAPMPPPIEAWNLAIGLRLPHRRLRAVHPLALTARVSRLWTTGVTPV